MIYSLVSWLIILHAVPQPIVNWVSDSVIKIRAEGREELLDRCLEGGVAVRYRFEMRYCTRGRYWLDNCQPEVVEIRTLTFDPLKETFTLRADQLGDDQEPKQTTIVNKVEAIENLTTIESVDLVMIAKGRPIKQNVRDYVGVRVVSDCKGSVGGVLLDISHFISLGLIKINRFDSDWVAFYLNK